MPASVTPSSDGPTLTGSQIYESTEHKVSAPWRACIRTIAPYGGPAVSYVSAHIFINNQVAIRGVRACLTGALSLSLLSSTRSRKYTKC